MMQAVDMVRELAAAALAAPGVIAFALSVIAALRAPDTYVRAHALKTGAIVSAPLMAAGLAVASGDGAVALRLALIAAVTVVCALTIAQLTANAAHRAGMTPTVAFDAKHSRKGAAS